MSALNNRAGNYIRNGSNVTQLARGDIKLPKPKFSIGDRVIAVEGDWEVRKVRAMSAEVMIDYKGAIMSRWLYSLSTTSNNHAPAGYDDEIVLYTGQPLIARPPIGNQPQ